MIFGSVKDEILELVDSLLGVFRIEIVARQLGAHLEPKACGLLGTCRKEDPIIRSFHLASEVNGASCLQ